MILLTDDQLRNALKKVLNEHVEEFNRLKEQAKLYEDEISDLTGQLQQMKAQLQQMKAQLHRVRNREFRQFLEEKQKRRR